MKFEKTNRVLVIVLSGALLAVPALAGVGKSGGQRGAPRLEKHKFAAIETMGSMECPMKDHPMAEHHGHKDNAVDHEHKHIERR